MIEELDLTMRAFTVRYLKLREEVEVARRLALVLRASPHCEHAKLHYRAGRYAYLHEHRPGGRRFRLYVGCCPARIRKAELLVARGRRVTQARQRLSDMDAICAQLIGAIESLGAMLDLAAE